MKYIFTILTLIFISCSDKSSTTSTEQLPSDPQASSATKTQYARMWKLMDKGVMLGHQDALAYGNMWYGKEGQSDVKSVSGDYPAVIGWNLDQIELKSAFNKDSVSFDKIREYIKEVHLMKGITVVSWAAIHPLSKDSISNNIKSVIAGGSNNAQYISTLDCLANFFLSLKDDSGNYIPVVFRPFYNANISYSWWGNYSSSSEDFKTLWKMTINHLRKKGVHNILYTYSTYNPTSLHEVDINYPGDAYVDIVGADLYLKLEDDPEGRLFAKNLDRSLSIISKFSKERKKIPALTDTGLEGIKLSNFFTVLLQPSIEKYRISYILFGRNAWNVENHYHVPIQGHPASDDFVEFIKNGNILTISKLD